MNKQVVLSGHTTSYIEAGIENPESIVFIHDGAFGTTADLCWGSVMELLSEKYHVLAPELYGWGKSDKHYPFGESPYTYRIEQVTQWLDYVGVSNAVFVGASFGGSLVLRAAMEDGNPWNVRGAISITGAGGLFRPAAAVEALSSYTPSYEEAERLTKLVVTSTEGLSGHIQQRYENSLIPGHWECLMAPSLRNPGFDHERPRDIFPDKLLELKIPTLFVEGKHDELLEPNWAQELANYAPNSRAIVVESSHEPNIDQPELVQEFVQDFMAQIKADPAAYAQMNGELNEVR